MGCDIHAHIEYQWPPSAESPYRRWEHFAAVDLERWYGLFGAMAGVRIAEIAHVPPRGMPEDKASDTLRAALDDAGDAHTHSWLTFAEFKGAVERAAGFATPPTGEVEELHVNPDVIAVWAAMETFEARGWPTRIVFWFDN